MRNDFCSNYLEHSAKGTTWKKGTSYLKRVWKNGKWIYEYPVTGKGYKREKQEHISKAIKSSQKAEEGLSVVRDKRGIKKESARNYAANMAKESEYHGRKAAEANSNYYTKSAAGKLEKAVESGKKKIANILSKLKTTEKVTVKDTFTGETRTPNRSGETINVKQAAEKNKKIVSDDGKTKVTVSSNISPKKKKKK